LVTEVWYFRSIVAWHAAAIALASLAAIGVPAWSVSWNLTGWSSALEHAHRVHRIVDRLPERRDRVNG
jgi:hypothetical protein